MAKHDYDKHPSRFEVPPCWLCGSPSVKTDSRSRPICRRHAAGLPDPVSVPTQPGRNEPCLCGSGKKFKRCCKK